MQILHDGVIGAVYMAKGLCYKRRDTIGKAIEELLIVIECSDESEYQNLVVHLPL
jgi:hypothetical protein